MKHWLQKGAAAVLALGILAAPVRAASVLQQSRLPLADRLTLTSACLETEQTQQENFLIYQPGGDIQPMVVFGNTLYGRSTMDYIANYLADRKLVPVAAVNASFFDMSNGLPMGIVITDGILRSSGSGTAVGILPDGSLKLGSPTLKVEGALGNQDILLHYNQLLTENNGIVLYSRDYDTRTKGAVEGYHVVLEAEEGYLRPAGKQKAVVTNIVEKTKLCTIPENGFVLSLAEAGTYEPYQKAIRSLKPGDTVTLTTTIDDDWTSVAYAVGGGDMLVDHGTVCTDFWLDSANRAAPRTALGIRRNGDVVAYTVDRKEGSAGMTLPELAQRMAELDCVTAMNLDGGGSTCVGVTRPGEWNFLTVNEPSDGQQRPCANYLFFVRPVTASGPATQLFVYPHNLAVLPGGQVTLTARAADKNYMPAALPGDLIWSSSNGSVSGGVFAAYQPGTAKVTVHGGGMTGSAQVHVVETPSTMTVLRQDTERAVRDILIESGTVLDLTAEARYLGTPLAAQDSSFTWSLTDGLGTVDENGLLSAGEQETDGVLTVSCGDYVVEIPLEVRINPMTDLEGHWARESISQLYFRGVLQGSANAEGEMVYRPDASMTRQEFIVALMRWLDLDLSEYRDVALPFADADKIADWAMDAMKAAYELGYLTGSAKNGKVYAEPGTTITREAAMTILARTQKAESESDALGDFDDENDVSVWARPALTAMVEQGVINGINGKLQPQGQVTRAQVAKMLFVLG